jgi:predicted DNA-binding protein (MmcQ/YjbR family)
MNGKAATEYCLSRMGAREDFPFGPEVMVIKVASKMFALISSTESKTVLSLKCDPFLAQDFRQRYPSITSGYHLHKKHWNSVVLNGSVPEEEIKWMIDHSYELVSRSLTKAEKEAL